MASNADNARAVINTIKYEYPAPVSEQLTEIFQAFNEATLAHAGEIFNSFPTALPLTEREGRTETVKEYFIHAAWFRVPGTEEAFAAIAYDIATGKCIMATSEDPPSEWFPGLDEGLRFIATRMVIKEEQDKIGKSTLH